MRPIGVLISGASIAGPALASLLSRYGARVTVVESAPGLRPGGQAVDFKGSTHLEVLKRMGILVEVRRRRAPARDTVFVDGDGRELAIMPSEFTGGDLEILRGDLARVLYEAGVEHCEYVFGDSISSITESDSGVQVSFDHGEPRTFDLVVGADGIHSNVRRQVFGPQERYVTHLGHYYAIVNGERGDGRTQAVDGGRRSGRMYNEPGRMAAIDGPDEPAFFVFASAPLDVDRFDPVQTRRVLAEAYAGAGWEVGDYVADVLPTAEIHLDSISKVQADHYHRGRTVLLGDAAYGNTLGGFGTGLALVGAYVLAAELAAADGDHTAAFPRYQALMYDYAKIARTANAGPFLAPSTRMKIRMRNWIFRYRPLLRMMMRLGDSYATDIELPDHPPSAGEGPAAATRFSQGGE
jgi:2-polyprenyl-6-methoxyphenol hydroxylase-like FAD-dependent oxidoreductase